MVQLNKGNFFYLILLLAILWTPMGGYANQQYIESLKTFLSLPLKENEVAYMHLGKSSNIVIRVDGKMILFDPSYLLEDELSLINKKGVDLVLFTHRHSDHFDKETALNIFKGSKSYIIAEQIVAERIGGKVVPAEKMVTIASSGTYSTGDITIDALRGEHTCPIMLFRVTINGKSIFHGGDSAYVPLKTMASQIAFVPTGGASPTCRPEFAFHMISDIKPRIAIPMHGNDDEHRKLYRMVGEKMPDTKVIISKPGVFQKVRIH